MKPCYLTVVPAALVLSAACAAILPVVNAAEPSYPTRPVRLLVPFPPGGGADTMARIITPKLHDAMGQPWIVDNRGGAAGNIAADIVAKASPDGHTVFLGFATTLTVNPTLYRNLSYDVQRDLRPVVMLASSLYMLVVHPSVSAISVKEFIALAKAKPGSLNYSSGGVGTPLHLAAELFKYRAGVDLVHVPFKGGGPASTAVVAGEVQVLFGSLPSSFPYVQAGRLKGLAVTSTKRAAVAPAIPTIAESGFPGFDVTSWYGLLVPTGTPAGVMKRMHDDTMKVMSLPEVRQAIERRGLEITLAGPQDFDQLIREQTVVWAKLIKAAGIKAE